MKLLRKRLIKRLFISLIFIIQIELLGCAHDKRQSYYERAVQEYQQNEAKGHASASHDHEKLRSQRLSLHMVFLDLIDRHVEFRVKLYDTMFPYK